MVTITAVIRFMTRKFDLAITIGNNHLFYHSNLILISLKHQKCSQVTLSQFNIKMHSTVLALGSVDVDLCIFAAFVGILCKAESMRCSYST